jgi:cytochrome P450
MSDQVDPVVIDARFIQDAHEAQAELREHASVQPVAYPSGMRHWLVTRHEDVKAMMADTRLSRDWDGLAAVLRSAGDDPDREFDWMYRNILYLDPPDHTRLRRLVSPAFTPRRIEWLRPRIAEIADGLLAQIESQAAAGGGAVDLMAAFAAPLPQTVISELIGIPEADRPDFAAWSDVLNGADPDADEAGTLREAVAYLDALADRKRAEPGPDLLSHMVTASEDGDRLSRRELISMTLLMVLAGQDTTVNLLGNGILAFLRAPDQLALVRADPRLLPAAVEEIVRYDCPVNITIARFTTEPIVLGGAEIPAGEVLNPAVLAANRDVRQFARPDEFDITRDTRGHLGFGLGIHYCLGAPLARLEGDIALGKLFERFPRLRLAAAPDSLAYRNSRLLHGLVSLPVYVR